MIKIGPHVELEPGPAWSTTTRITFRLTDGPHLRFAERGETARIIDRVLPGYLTEAWRAEIQRVAP